MQMDVIWDVSVFTEDECNASSASESNIRAIREIRG